ncbi:hypothetical protein SAMN04487975_11048 [Planococcus glaciei]|uniref:hypothetical protein n=1 Tax=Planococcus glaciei TaxID=459472 RepID=UPI00087FF82C|nr:hypothetical protein [Planococcus glaciei]SDH94976.1 hypothetical protein SAMN04487975_11048 [Planococcus glaciei]
MEVWLPWLATVLFGYFAITSLYAGVKPYKKDEERGFDDPYTYGTDNFAIIGLFFIFVLWVSEKLFPPRFQLIVFRMVALLTSLLMIGLIYLFWHFF